MAGNPFRRFLLNRGYYFEKTQPLDDIRALIASMNPQETDRQLVRVGVSGDGGYLVPDDLDGLAACFSPGVGASAHFEEDMASRGLDCFMADYSVDEVPVENPRFHFQKKFLGSRDQGAFMRLDSWVEECCVGAGDLILQMDIEGAEYPVLLDCSQHMLERFRIIVIEFHDLNRLFSRPGFALISQVFEKLLRSHVVVHMHPNNCKQSVVCKDIAIPPLLEMTLLRQDRIGTMKPVTHLPHPLDADCVPSRPSVPLPNGWFGG